MSGNVRVAILVLLLCTLPLQAQVASLAITHPADREEVVERPYVEGTVSTPKAAIWVIVHPMEGSEYWVQPRVTVRHDRKWKVKIYIGRPGTGDVGKQFEVRAIANPSVGLAEGQVLDDWPGAEAISNVVEVTRKE